MKNSIKQSTKLYSTVLALGSLATSATAGAADFADDVYDALAGGKVSLDLRLFFERLEEDNPLDDASLLSLRSRLGYETGKINNFSALLEFENTTAIGNDDNYSLPAASPFSAGVGQSIIPDPEFSEVNQAYLNYSGFDETVIKLGRERINLDNQRFIGSVAWRQNEQTFDGFSISNNSLSDTSLFYSFASNANNVFGANIDVDLHILNAAYNGFTAGKLVGYAYLSDFQNANTNDNRTVGIRFDGATPVGGNEKILYTAEYARQSDSNDNPNSFDHDYILAEGGLAFGPGISAKLSYELLGSENGDTGFFTPFSTIHKFQGWADVFLVPTSSALGLPNGIEDIHFTLAGKAGPINLVGVYHDFSSDVGGIDYGSEFNFLATTKVGRFDLGAKFADYSADEFGVDTTRYWFWVQTSI